MEDGDLKGVRVGLRVYGEQGSEREGEVCVSNFPIVSDLSNSK